MDLVDRLYDQHYKDWKDKILSMKEMILANLVMISQIPAKTYEEQARASFILDRFIECDTQEPTIDEIGNVIARIPGRKPGRTILLTAHIDTLFDESSDHNVTITSDTAQGTGIADNSLGVTFLITLPDILKKLNIEFESDIILLGTVSSKERGDLSGMRYYMKKHHRDVDFNLNIEGISFGQIDHSALSRVRCDIECNMETETTSSWRSLGQNSAIMMLSDVLDSLFSIPLPHKPKTVLNVGKVDGGTSYSRLCPKASLNLEVRSEDDQITEKLIEEIRDNCHDIGAKYGTEINLNFFSRHHAAGIKYSHPLVRCAGGIAKKMGVKSKMGPANSEIAIPLSLSIPSITIGLTTGSEDKAEKKSYIDLEPLPDGILQALLLITAIDKGYCDEEH